MGAGNDRIAEARRLIAIYDDSEKSMDFTVYMSNLEKRDRELFDLVIRELKNGSYNVRYLNIGARG